MVRMPGHHAWIDLAKVVDEMGQSLSVMRCDGSILRRLIVFGGSNNAL